MDPPADWHSATERVILSIPHDPSMTPVVVVGPKRSGKSTYVRHMANTLCEQRRDLLVWLLDCDCGQPLLTPPGLVSIHNVQDPIPDAMEVPLVTPQRAYFIGDTSPQHCPKLYMDTIRALWTELCASSGDTQVVVLVNTMGWVTGMGGELLDEILGVVGPKHVVELSQEPSVMPMDCTVHRVTSLWSPAAEGHDRPGAADMRARQLAAYLGIASRSLADVVPVSVPMSSVRLEFVTNDIPLDLALHAMDCTLVGLVDAAGSCVGLGFVRACDTERGVLHVVTPVPLSTLNQSVTTLVRGPLSLPPSLLPASGPYFVTQAIDVAVRQHTRPLQRRR